MTVPSPKTDDSKSWRSFVLFVVVIAVFAGGFVVLRRAKEPPSAEEVLADAKAYVAAHPSLRLRGSVLIEIKERSSDKIASDSLRTKITAEIQDSDHQRAVIDSGSEGAVETIVDGSKLYIRTTATMAELTSAKFAVIDLTAPGINRAEFDQVKGLNVGSLLDASHNIRRVAHTGSTATIRTDVDQVALLGAEAAAEVEGITLKLVVKRSGEIISAEQITGGGGAIITTSLTYADWGEPVTINAPSDDQLEQQAAV